MKTTTTTIVRTKKAVVRGRPVITFVDFSLRLGRAAVLHRINLKVPLHKVVAVVGPSGSGKSTLIRALNRMNQFCDRVRVTGQI